MAKFSIGPGGSFIDELLFPMSYYESMDELLFQTPDSIRRNNKMSFAHVQFSSGTDDTDHDRFYTWYDKSGRPSQTANRQSETGDSTIHRWKYNNAGELSAYVTIVYDSPDENNTKLMVSGDSVIFHYTTRNEVSEIVRYSIRNSGATRSASLVSREAFVYNSKGEIASRSGEGYKLLFTYDSLSRPVLVHSQGKNGYKYVSDSLAWKSGPFFDTLEHWFVPTRELIDQLIYNNATSAEVSYTLYADKYNYFRNIGGPVLVNYSYDVSGKLVRRAGYSIEGVLKFETVYEYNSVGICSGFQILTPRDPSLGDETLPPAAKNFNGNLFVSVHVQYLSSQSTEFPAELEISTLLVGMKGDTRQVLAHGRIKTRLNIVYEYY